MSIRTYAEEVARSVSDLLVQRGLYKVVVEGVSQIDSKTKIVFEYDGSYYPVEVDKYYNPRKADAETIGVVADYIVQEIQDVCDDRMELIRTIMEEGLKKEKKGFSLAGLAVAEIVFAIICTVL